MIDFLKIYCHTSVLDHIEDYSPRLATEGEYGCIVMDILLPGSELLNNSRTDKRVVFHRRAHLEIANGTLLPVNTIDISLGGVGIICPSPIQERQNCTLKIDMITPDMPDLLLKGASTYCILSGMRGFRVGIQYSDIAEPIITHVKRLMQRLAF